jgi:uncharacterized protein YjiS (DUF1127 family)
MSNHAMRTAGGHEIGFIWQGRETSVLARAGQAIASAWSSYREWAEARRATRHLAGLDDRMLRDIGVSRSEINRMVYGPTMVKASDHDRR